LSRKLDAREFVEFHASLGEARVRDIQRTPYERGDGRVAIEQELETLASD
jgi:hypothetical protein